MTTMTGFMESARHYLPDFVVRKRRPSRQLARSVAVQPSSDISVSDLIERQIIPRLVIAHRRDDEGVCPTARLTSADANNFVELAIELEADALLDHVEKYLRNGISIDRLFIDLLAPTARRLGELWDDDLCDFIDVTMALWRLQEIVRELSTRFPVRPVSSDPVLSALFATSPGDQHSFGAVMLEDMFRRDGWVTDLLLESSTPVLLDRVARSPVDIVGLTVSLDAHIERLPSLIVALRSVSRNPQLCIMLGGRCLACDPALASRIGADGTASDAAGALNLAKRLVGEAEFREASTA